MSDFGNFMKNLRKKANLSQNDVAVEMGYSSPQFISNWERGVSTPPLSSVKTISKLYKTSAVDIFKALKVLELQAVEKKFAKLI